MHYNLQEDNKPAAFLPEFYQNSNLFVYHSFTFPFFLICSVLTVYCFHYRLVVCWELSLCYTQTDVILWSVIQCNGTRF